LIGEEVRTASLFAREKEVDKEGTLEGEQGIYGSDEALANFCQPLTKKKIKDRGKGGGVDQEVLASWGTLSVTLQSEEVHCPIFWNHKDYGEETKKEPR